MSYVKRIARHLGMSENLWRAQPLGTGVDDSFDFPCHRHRMCCLSTVCFVRERTRVQSVTVETSRILNRMNFRKRAAVAKMSGLAWSKSHSDAIRWNRYHFNCDGPVQRVAQRLVIWSGQRAPSSWHDDAFVHTLMIPRSPLLELA